eukprot:m.369826 g.369826  ORF g.369826 m.369826 type:complete len:1036 (-) comp19990_c0_seq16:3441-6548(-)
MGATISKRAQFGQDGLEFTRGNEQLLNDLQQHIHALARDNPKEAAVVFDRPLAFKTTVTPQQLAGDQAFSAQGSVVTSVATSPAGTELYSLSNGSVSILTFEYLAKHLKAANEKATKELQQGLTANRTPLNNILGAAFAGNTDLAKVHERLSGSEQDEAKFRLLLHLNSLDVKLLHSSVDQMSKEVRLNVHSVEAEVDLLKAFAGHSETNCLEMIDWESSYTFSNGLRSPPWRQVHGDLAYIIAKPSDGDLMAIVANVNGYWQVQRQADGSLNYDRVGDVHSTLVGLLRNASAHFNATIDKQEFTHKPVAEERDVVGDFMSKPAATAVGGRRSSTTRIASKPSSASRKKANSTGVQPRNLQPSQKWATLGLDLKPQPKKKKSAKKPPSAAAGNGRSARSSRAASAVSSLSRFGRPQYDDDDDDFFSETDEELDDDIAEIRPPKKGDLPPEYWSIQKLVKFLSGGNQTATIIALCSLRDFNLTSEACQFAVLDVGGLEVLVNLLETDDLKCKIGALQVLRDVTQSADITKAVADMEGMRPMIRILTEGNGAQVTSLAAETIANCAAESRNRRAVRRFGGIEKLVSLLSTPADPMSGENAVARSSAKALWSCSKSLKNKQRILLAGAAPLLAELVKSDNVELLIPVVATLSECCTEPEYRELVRELDMVPHLVSHLSKEDKNLQAHTATALFRCGEDEAIRRIVRECEGLQPLVNLLQHTTEHDLVYGATGAIWKTAKDPSNVTIYAKLKAVEQLCDLSRSQPEDVLVNVVGALSALAANASCAKAVRTAGAIPTLVDLLTGTNQNLLINVCKALEQCAQDPDNRKEIDRLDGVRLLWSLLKSSNTELQASAAWAICPCISSKESGDLVRSFVGGLELIVGLLRSEDTEVLASVCAAIANVAKDHENLGIISDHDVVQRLSLLVRTSNDKLRQHIADAVAQCCEWGQNRVAFGVEDAVGPLVKYLKSKKPEVHRATARALFQLSKDPDNCITMHESGVVKPLVALIGSEDPQLQESAASCIANIRRLALASEMQQYA